MHLHGRLLGVALPLSLSVGLGCAPDPTLDNGFSTFTTFPGDGDGDPGDGDGETGDTVGDGDGDGDGDGTGECGNAMIEMSKQYDLGPANSDTGQCTTSCLIAACGDGLVYEGSKSAT